MDRTSYQEFRSIAASEIAGAESAPTSTTSGWGRPLIYAGANAIEVNVSRITDAVNATLWVRQRINGVVQVIAFDTFAVQDHPVRRVVNPPVGDYYITFSGAVTGPRVVFIRSFMSNAQLDVEVTS